MAVANSFVLLSKERGHVVASEQEVCDASVVTAHIGARVLDELGRLHVAGNGGGSSLEEPHFVLQLKRHGLVHEGKRKVDESGVTSEHGERERIFWRLRNNLAHRQQRIIFPAYVADVDLVIY